MILMIAMVVVVFGALTLVAMLALGALDKGAAAQVERIKKTTANDLADSFVFVDFKKLAGYSLAAFIVIPIAVWLLTGGNMLLVVASLIIPIMAPKFLVNRIKNKRLKLFREQFPDALVSLASSMRAGASLSMALETLMRETKAPLSEEFGILLRSQRLGMSFDDALKNMEKRLPLQEFYLFTAGMRIAREVGGNLADMLDALAETMFKTMQTEGKIAALTSQGKMQGYVMSALPLFMILALNWLQPKEMYPLFHSPTGWVVLGVIGVMITLGYLGISAVTNIDV